MRHIDKAGKKYWDDNWSNIESVKAFDENDQSLDNYVNLQFHKFFKKNLETTKNFSILEIGCANSIWPLYFHKYFNAKVSGLDYSEIGCEKSRELLKYYNVPGKVFCADLFAPPAELIQKYDVVFSFGVVEHFEDTAHCLKSCAAFVKPGGILLTIIPNIPSIIGLIQRFVDKAVYDIHVPLTRHKLMHAHDMANFASKIDCDHFMSLSLNVVNSGAFALNFFNPFFRRILSGISKISWFLEKKGIKIPKNRWTSPYIIAIAKVK